MLSPRVIDAIARRYRHRDIRRSLLEELRELRVRLAMLAARVAFRNATVTREFVKWQMPILSDYHGFYADPKVTEMLAKAAEMTDAQLQAASVLLRKPGRALGLKKFDAPFLEAHLSDLHLFPIEFERRARELSARLKMLNEDVDQAWYFFTKTFDASLSSENLEIIRGNLEETCSAVGPRAKDLADGITQIIELADHHQGRAA